VTNAGMRGRPIAPLALSPEEQAYLERQVRRHRAGRSHYHVHFTPTSASWTDQVERWFAELTRKQIQRGVHTCVRQLEVDIRTFIDLHNKNPKPFKWTKCAQTRFWLPSKASATKLSRLYVTNFRFTRLSSQSASISALHII
jgi:hypothetical protein